MSTESAPLDPYDAVLLDLRAKRDQINQAIAAIEALRGNAPASAAVRAAEPAIVETAGMYLGMSIVDATKKLLALRKETLGNVEIARAIQAGGLVLTGADPVNVVGSVLTRRFNQVGDVVKMGRGIWGLKEWYPGRNFKPPMKIMQSEAASGEQAMSPEAETMMNANLEALHSTQPDLPEVAG